MKQAIRQSCITVFMSIAAVAIQYAAWDPALIFMATFFVIVLGGIAVAAVGEME